MAVVDRAAVVTVIDPSPSGFITQLADEGRIELIVRRYRPGDLAGAWFAMAATDEPGTNTAVAAEAEATRTFCVRADVAGAGTAVTPASGAVAGALVAVFTTRVEPGAGLVYDPARSRDLRDRAVDALRSRSADR
jgi:uroporphyrin-III C-methyltransferase/precorrin-2 dehydrogenase/sirohydrochlorin ferrochelatase